jgi:hypothetical protein
MAMRLLLLFPWAAIAECTVHELCDDDAALMQQATTLHRRSEDPGSDYEALPDYVAVQNSKGYYELQRQSPAAQPVQQKEGVSDFYRYELQRLASELQPAQPAAQAVQAVQNKPMFSTMQPYNVAISVMLIGCIVFVMLLIYLVNWPDQDIRLYAWTSISVTLSIFCAVLMFSGTNNYLLAVLAKSWSDFDIVLLQYAHFFFWVCVLQTVLAWQSGAILEGKAGFLLMTKRSWVQNDALRYDYEAEVDKKNVRNTARGIKNSVTIVNGVEVPVVKKKLELETRERKLKCWGMILGHMAAFADIQAGADLQNLPFFSSSPYMAVLPIFINLFIVWSLYMAFDYVRESKRARVIAEGLPAFRIHLCDEEAEETEEEVISLSSSFMIVQVAIFAITGNMPPAPGGVVKPWTPTMWAAGVLFAVGLVSVVLAVIFNWLLSQHASAEEVEESSEEEEDEATMKRQVSNESMIRGKAYHDESGLWQRFQEVFMTTTLFTFAWSCKSASSWSYACIAAFQGTPMGIASMGGQVLHALFISLGAFLVILCIDKADDCCDTNNNHFINAVVGSIAILVGLSWEATFEHGFAEMVIGQANAQLLILLISFFVCLLIIPAWRRHILKKALQLKAYKEEEIKAQARLDAKPSLAQNRTSPAVSCLPCSS